MLIFISFMSVTFIFIFTAGHSLVECGKILGIEVIVNDKADLTA